MFEENINLCSTNLCILKNLNRILIHNFSSKKSIFLLDLSPNSEDLDSNIFLKVLLQLFKLCSLKKSHIRGFKLFAN